MDRRACRRHGCRYGFELGGRGALGWLHLEFFGCAVSLDDAAEEGSAVGCRRRVCPVLFWARAGTGVRAGGALILQL